MVLVVRMTSYKLNKTIQCLHYPSCFLQSEHMCELPYFCYQRQPFARTFSEYDWEVYMYIKIIFSQRNLSPPVKWTMHAVHVLSLYTVDCFHVRSTKTCVAYLREENSLRFSQRHFQVRFRVWNDFYPLTVWIVLKMIDACQETLRYDILPP